MYLGGYPMLARSWEKDRQRVFDLLSLYSGVPIWMALFVEGTRFSLSKLAQVPPQQHVFFVFVIIFALVCLALRLVAGVC